MKNLVDNSFLNTLLWAIVATANLIISLNNPDIGWIAFGVFVISTVVIFRAVLYFINEYDKSKKRKLDKLDNPLV